MMTSPPFPFPIDDDDSKKTFRDPNTKTNTWFAAVYPNAIRNLPTAQQ